MKKAIFAIFILINFTLLFAKDDLVQKAMGCYSDFSNHTIEFKTTKSGDGYDIKIVPQNPAYSQLFDSNCSLHISVDEGPIVTNPHFSLAKAGLSGSANLLDIFNKSITKDIKSLIKDMPKYHYEGIVNFSNTLKSKTVIEPISIADKDAKIELSKIDFDSTLNIDSCTGDGSAKIDSITIYPTNGTGKLIVKGLEYNTEVTQTPIDGYTIFGKNSLKVDSLYFLAKQSAKGVETNSSIELSSFVSKLDSNHLKLNMHLKTTALDAKTIAQAKGIKSVDFNLDLINAQIDGILDLLKLSKKLEETQAKLQKAQIANDDIALQKAIFELNNLGSIESVKVYNKIFIKDKTKLKLDLELESDKTSFVKLDLLYKAKPISGNIEGAIIELAAQNLAIADGTFEIKLDSQLANTVTPLATLILDMLKTKGLITVQNGIYHLKGELKSGKIVIDGKAYTLQELGTILF